MAGLTAILAGASGLVGGEILDRLVGAAEYERVIVVTRRDLGARVRHPKVKQALVDFERLDDAGRGVHGDHVFCALGTTIRKAGSQAKFRQVDLEYPLALARVALARGAGHFAIVSAMGASRTSPFFYSRVKGEVEAGLRAMTWPSLAIFRPSFIAGERSESRPLERLGGCVLRIAPAGWRPVAAGDIAAAMIATALRSPRGVTVVESRDIPRVAAGTGRSGT